MFNIISWEAPNFLSPKDATFLTESHEIRKKEEEIEKNWRNFQHFHAPSLTLNLPQSSETCCLKIIYPEIKTMNTLLNLKCLGGVSLLEFIKVNVTDEVKKAE